jgi:hypothetical protein
VLTVEDVRRAALDLPQAEETTHFRMVSFAVNKKNFAVVQNELSALALMSEPEAGQCIAQAPDVYEPVTRFDKLIGVRIHLDRASVAQLESAVAQAWRCKAPRKLVVTYETGNKDS